MGCERGHCAATTPGRVWPAALVFFVSLAVYVRTLSPSVFVEGTGENIVCAWTLSIPHPPGFPLFCLLAKAFAEVLRVGSVAYRVNLFSAVMGAGAAAGLHLLLNRCLGLGRLAAAGAALCFAFSATFWRQATIAEVYSLDLAVVVAQIALLTCWRRGVERSHRPVLAANETGRRSRGRQGQSPARGVAPALGTDRCLLWFAFSFGLGMAVHYSHLLLLPAYAYFIIATDPGVLHRGRTAVSALLLLLLAAGLHIYAPIRSLANPPIDWGNPETLANWWAYLSAQQYQERMFQLPLSQVTGNLAHFAADLPAEFWWPGLLAAAAGALVLFRQDRRLFWSTSLMIGVAVVWAANYDIPWEIEVYYLQALLAMALWIAFALHWLGERLSPRKLRAFAPVLLLPSVLLLIVNARRNDLSEQTFVLDDARGILASAGPGATVVLPSTNPTFALIYLTRVEGEGGGVQLWSETEAGVTPTEQAVHPSQEVVPFPIFALNQERSAEGIYLVERRAESALGRVAQIPWGCLYRAVPASQAELWRSRAPAPSPSPFRIEGRPFLYGAEERLIACRSLLLQGDYAWDRGDRALADAFYQQAHRIGADLVAVAAHLGLRYSEQRRPQIARQVYEEALKRHDDALLRNRLGAVYGRLDRLEQAEQQFRRAIKLKPDYADAHANLGSVYGRAGRMQDAIRETEYALACDPNHLLALRNLGFSYAYAGRRTEAKRMLERALDIDPDQQDVRALLEAQ